MIKGKDFKTALQKIKENPDNHGYSKEDYDSVMSLDKTLTEFGKNISENLKRMTEQMNAAFSAIHFSFKKFFEKLEETKFIVSDNWYVSFNLLERLSIQELLEIFDNKDENTFQKFISDTFPLQQDKIFNKIRKTVTNRETLISEIEQLYNHKYYASVVVLCYTQVDGICNENLGYGFFDTDKKTFNLKIIELEPNESLASKIAFQLKSGKNEITRFVKNEVENQTFNKASYNRHLVLHGHSINYGNQINAIRAILLLDFICALISEGVINTS